MEQLELTYSQVTPSETSNQLKNNRLPKVGIYSFTVTSRGKSAVTIAVGEQEIPGDVIRGPMPAPK